MVYKQTNKQKTNQQRKKTEPIRWVKPSNLFEEK